MIDLCQPCKERGKFRVPSLKWKGVDVCGDCYTEKEKSAAPATRLTLGMIAEDPAFTITTFDQEHEEKPMDKTEAPSHAPKCQCSPDCPQPARAGKPFAWGHRKRDGARAITKKPVAISPTNGVPGNEHALKNPAIANAVKVLENQRAGLLERVAKLDAVIATLIEID